MPDKTPPERESSRSSSALAVRCFLTGAGANLLVQVLGADVPSLRGLFAWGLIVGLLFLNGRALR